MFIDLHESPYRLDEENNNFEKLVKNDKTRKLLCHKRKNKNLDMKIIQINFLINNFLIYVTYKKIMVHKNIMAILKQLINTYRQNIWLNVMKKFFLKCLKEK